MSQTILLIDYEPRTVARVQEALAPLGANVLVAKDVDSAVAECSKTEPRVVLITSVLPRVSVEDAITQLRARAGLRTTPFLVLTSGYSGDDTRADAARLGAADLVIKPFSNEALLEQVRIALQAPRATPSQGAESRAEVIEALRRSAGIADGGTVTSEDIFGDLLESEPEAKPAPAPTIPRTAAEPPPPVQVPEPPRPMKPVAADLSVDKVLESTLAEMRGQPAKSTRPKETASTASVDDLLSQTLSGLKVQIPRGGEPAPAAKPAAAEVTPAVPEVPRTEPAKTVAIPLREIPIAPTKPARATGEHAQGPLPGGSPFGQYELMQLIATGGMAEVYKAKMRGVEGFQKIVAIKRILPHLTDNDEFVTMFVDEAKLAAQLQHPNIIHIYDLGKIERSYYIAMEYIDGKDLRSILKLLGERRTKMPLGHALFVASKLAAALDYAHRKHDLSGRAMALVHRDVSPQNVLISFDGEVKLCDFGIAKAASKASHTRAGALKGKLQYMSPEQAWGKDIDHRSDIFSLGLVLYEMATGRKAFAGDSELSILEQVRTPKLVPPRDIEPSIPPQVERLIFKTLKEQREERYETAGELAAEIDELMQNLRPAPSAPDLGSFLTELVGRAEVPVPKAPAPKAAEPPLPEIEALV
ncbi:MAG: protein kinase domain-containing protein, partial [Acidobacteriota bacterium]